MHKCFYLDAKGNTIQVHILFWGVVSMLIMLCGVKVKAEQVSHESFVEDGE